MAGAKRKIAEELATFVENPKLLREEYTSLVLLGLISLGVSDRHLQIELKRPRAGRSQTRSPSCG